MRERGQICALAVSSKVVPPIQNNISSPLTQRVRAKRTDGEEQRLEVLELRLGELEQARALVHRRAGRLLVRLERVRGDHEQGGAGVDDAGGAGEERGVRAVREVLVDAPVVASGGGGRDGDEGDVARDPGKYKSYGQIQSDVNWVNDRERTWNRQRFRSSALRSGRLAWWSARKRFRGSRCRSFPGRRGCL